MSQLGDTFVIVSQVIKLGEFNIFGNDPSRWYQSFITLKSICPNVEGSLRIKCACYLGQTAIFSTISMTAQLVKELLFTTNGIIPMGN